MNEIHLSLHRRLVNPELTAQAEQCVQTMSQSGQPSKECETTLQKWSDSSKSWWERFARDASAAPPPPDSTPKCGGKFRGVEECLQKNRNDLGMCKTSLEEARACHIEFLCPKPWSSWKRCNGAGRTKDITDVDITDDGTTCVSELVDLRECLTDIELAPLKRMGIKLD